MALILLRHTRPEGAEGLCYGRLDLSLDAGFADEAARLARELPAFSRIVTSPLGRCARLAAALGVARGLAVEPEASLQEMDFGRWEGRLWADLPRGEIDAWAADLTGARPHGGETVAELAARSLPLLRGYASEAGGTVLAVCHAGVIKAALAASQGPQGWRAEIPFGGWLRFDADFAPMGGAQ